jgi:hypothetical protein
MAQEEPRLLLADASEVLKAKLRADAGDLLLVSARDAILKTAAAKLEQKAPSVTEKKMLAPSGDPHDYMSLSTYSWPNPDTPDGLPYVRRDGQTNPEALQTDMGRFRHLASVVPTLAWAYFLSNDERFATKGIQFVRTWFLDPDTLMNPHLRYGGYIPGVVDGRNYGLTDVKSIRFILDTIGLLRASPEWSDADEKGMLSWVDEYLDWLLTSKFGRKECAAPNNHGTWYDAQVLACALFVGRQDAIAKVEESSKLRIAAQFDPQGAQPEEMVRTRALQYCMMNLHGFFEIATMLSTAGIDIWKFEAKDGQSLRRAAEWLAPYAVGQKRLPTRDIAKATPVSYLSVFRRAAIAWSDWRFEVVVNLIDSAAARTDVIQFQYPLEVFAGE